MSQSTSPYGYGRVDVDGEDSTLTSQGGAGMIRIGRSAGAEGHLNLTNGGQANGFFVDVGRNDASGYITVDGVGLKLTSSNQFGDFGNGDGGLAGFLRLGRDGGYGKLEITGGGEVAVRNEFGSINDQPIVNVGRGYNGEGLIRVSGSGIPPGDDLAVASSLNIFQDGPSNDGFRVGEYNGPLLQIGRTGGKGTVIAEYGAEINVRGEDARIFIGQSGDGSGPAPRSVMEINSGASVTVNSLGYQVGSQVSVGTESTGFGRLSIDGGFLNIISNNIDNVSATGGIELGANLSVGLYGEGDLIVQNGGQILIDGVDDAYPSFGTGVFYGAVGKSLITGAGSSVSIGNPFGGGFPPFGGGGTPPANPFGNGAIDVGNANGAYGRLTIADGASVSNAAEYSITQIGEEAGATGVLIVEDAGSVLNAGSNLQIGVDFDVASGASIDTGGDGTLRILNDANVIVGDLVEIGSNGKLEIDGTLSVDVTDPGNRVLNEGTIFVGGNSGIGDADINASLDNGIQGDLEFEFSGFGAGQFDTLVLNHDAAETAMSGDDIVLDMSALGVVNVGDTATILTFDSGVFPDLTGGTGTVNAVIQNAPPGVTFLVTQNASGDVIVEVTDAPNGSVSVEGFAQIVDEGDPGDTTQVVFTLTRNGDLTEQVTADFEIVGSGANPVDGADFDGGVLPVGQATFLANEATTTVTIDIAEDTDIEADEGFTFNLTGASSASGGVVLLNSSAPGILRNDDSPDVISIVNAVSGLEDDFGVGNSLFFDVTRTGDLTGDVTVDFVLDANGAIDGPDVDIDLLANSDDFVGGAPQLGQVTILNGQSTATIEIEIAQDADFEPREDFTISLTDFDGDPTAYIFGNQISTGTIISDDGIPPVIPVGLEADVFGDPHLVTLDGLGYDFQAVGEFTLVEATAGAPLNVQIRTAPVEGSDLVSIISAMAADMGQGNSIMIDVTSEPALLVNGSPTVIPATGVSPLDVGDGQVFFDGSAYTIVLGTGDAFKVDVFDDFMNVCTFLDPANASGRVLQGLLGNADGDLGNDFALRDGSPISVDQISFDVNGTPALEFDFLYGTYADSWRITDATSQFHYSGISGDEGTSDYTDTNFPVGVLSVDVLPADILADAIAAADAAGITDPVLRESAILDFALTGDAEFAAGAAGVAADPEVNTAPSSAPDLPATVGVTPVVTSIVEGNSGRQTVFFSVYRIGHTTGAFDVEYAIAGDIDAADIDPASSLTGTVSFLQGETTQTFSIDVLGDFTTEADENIVASITAPSNILIGAPSAITTIKTDDDPPVAVDDAQTAGTANGQTIAIADLLLNDRDPNGDPITILSVSDTTQGATVTLGATEVTIDPNGIFDLLAPGETATDSFTYTVTDGNGGTDTAVVSVTVGDTVGVSINDGNGNGVLTGSALADFIDGGGGADLVLAGDGDDQANGGTGSDAIAGEGGNDSLGGGFGNDILSGGDGNDTIFGGNDNDLMVGGDGQDTYFGGAGLDTVLFTDSINGLEIDLTDPGQNAGDAAGESFDSVERILGSNTASNTITGDAANNIFEGGAASDTLDGGGGNDLLRGNGGTDTFIGGDGDDLIFVDSSDDVVTENAGEGYDRVISSVSVTLGDNVEAGNLSGAGDLDMTGNASDNWLNGNSGDNALAGLTGNDRLDGNAGNDTLSGGEGNDLLEGGADADVFLAEFNAGFDRVLDFEDGLDLISLVPVDQTFADLVITDGAGGVSITHAGGTMRLDGITAADLSAADFIEGAGSVPTVIGSAAGEALFVSNGPVVLQGLGGNDLLGAFSGAATLEGGSGDDRYYVYEIGTVITELAGEGTDQVYTQVDLVLSDNVENAATNGAGDIDLTGNALGNFLSGNGDANLLIGLGGNDRLIGNAGDDTLDGGFGNDILEGGDGADTFLFIGPHDVDRIVDFELDTDTIDFGFSPVTFDDLTITGTTNAVISSVLGVIAVDGVSAAELTEDQFSFFEIPVLE